MKSIASDLLKNYSLMIALPVVIFIVMMMIAPQMVGTNNITSLFQQAIAPAVLGWGVLFNIKVGNWDFSVGSSVLLSAIIGGNIAVMLNLGIPGLIIFCLITGMVCGLLVGLVYKLLNIPTIIVSIGMMLIFESAGGYVFGGTGIFIPSGWRLLGTGDIFVIAIVAAVVAYILFYKTKIGYNVRAVGNNANVAMTNGLDVVKTKMSAILIAGLFAGAFAMLSLGTSGVQRTVSAMGTMGMIFDAMMCVFVGMAISRKGNLILSVYCGSLIMQLIRLALMVFGFPSEYNSIVIALLVLLFMTLSSRSDIFEKFTFRKNKRRCIQNEH
ncbi:MAG: ABC transporter permease [Defluviitaleaceae bacterium]|nr:ABC transporter permease [Defluviitaleaceae bacterium]